MRERARAVGGPFRIDSQPGKTVVSIEVDTPIIPPEADEPPADSETDARD